jgi:hypothetical protein
LRRSGSEEGLHFETSSSFFRKRSRTTSSLRLTSEEALSNWLVSTLDLDVIWRWISFKYLETKRALAFRNLPESCQMKILSLSQHWNIGERRVKYR